jgi:catalase (peroxidase I)
LARILLGEAWHGKCYIRGLARRLLTALEKKSKKNKNIPCSLSDLWYLKNMTTNNTTNPNEIPASTTLVKFTYAKPLKGGGVSVSQRIIRMGREVILPLLVGGSTWGKSNTQHRFVCAFKGDKDGFREYLQGAEEQEDGRLQIKRFDFSYVSNLEVLA